MAPRAVICIGFVACFVVTFYLLEFNTKSLVGPQSSVLPMPRFDRDYNPQDTSPYGRLQNQELGRPEHQLTGTVDENVRRIQSQNQTTQVKAAIAPDAQELILLVSSLGRGGSSWIGELLSNIKDEVMYVYEPMKIVSDKYESRITPAYSNEIMSSVFGCQFSKDFAMFQQVWPQNFKKYPDKCERGCRTPNTISRRCRLAETIVVKTIRMPLAHIEDLLTKPSFRHLKIIYLARDPRAQVLSRSNVFHIKNPDFNNECPRIDADVFAFHRLSQVFPGHFYFMRYEDMCLDPMGEAGQLWRFLQTNHSAEMPTSWKIFLSDHLKSPVNATKKNNPYSTYRDSATEWYKWRLEIQNSTLRLLDVEKECREAMDKMGYIPLKKLTNLRDLSIPFLKNYSCDFWNCWSYKF